MFKRTLVTLLALTACVEAVYQGFNSGAAFTDGSVKQQADFEKEFTTAKGLAGTNGAFTSVRLFTTIVRAICVQERPCLDVFANWLTARWHREYSYVRYSSCSQE